MIENLVSRDRILSNFPQSLTVLPLYTCTAECKDCCFESNPRIRGRLSLQTILERIDQSYDSFPTLRLIVFSGGECFLLKEDLFAAIAHCTAKGLHTRCVSNGYWGKTLKHASHVVKKLVESGLKEINFSTGLDHQEWVSKESVINAASFASNAGIRTVITVERDTDESSCMADLSSNPQIKKLIESANFSIMSNSWMPFHVDSNQRGKARSSVQLDQGCRNIFVNLVVTPHDKVAGCCGLTFEHIPEMKLGDGPNCNLKELYLSQFEDFLKIWIYVDGPYRIVQRLLGLDAEPLMASVVHHCQACVILHQHPAIREALVRKYQEFVPEVMCRFHIELAMQGRERGLKQEVLSAQPTQAHVVEAA